MSSPKILPSILLIFLCLLIAFFLLQRFVIGANSGVISASNQKEAEAQHQDKLKKYDHILSEAKDELTALNEESDQRMQDDIKLDQKLKALDAELGLSEGEFEQQYPGFSQQGDTQ